MTTEPAATPMPVLAQVRREAVRETLGGIIATITADIDGGSDAVEQAASDPDHRLCQAIDDRGLTMTADDETLTRIEQRWGLANTSS